MVALVGYAAFSVFGMVLYPKIWLILLDAAFLVKVTALAFLAVVKKLAL